MNQSDSAIKQKADFALKAVEYAINHADRQVNKDLLALLKEAVADITKGNYGKLDELKCLVYGSGRPDGSGSDNDIFSMEVQASSKAKALDEFLTDLIEEMEEFRKSSE